MNNTLAKEIVKHLMQEVEDGLERAKINRSLDLENEIENSVERHYYGGKIDAFEEVKMLLECWEKITR